MKNLIIVFKQPNKPIIHQCFYGKEGCVLMDKTGENSGGCKLCNRLWNPPKGTYINDLKSMCSDYDMSQCVAIEIDADSIFVKDKDKNFKLLKDIINKNVRENK